METTTMGFIGTTIRIPSFIPSFRKVSILGIATPAVVETSVDAIIEKRLILAAAMTTEMLTPPRVWKCFGI